MTGLGDERVSGPLKASSALPFKAELDGASAIGRFVAGPDWCTGAKRCLLENLVGACEQRSRDPEAERPSGLEIEGKPKHRWLFEWQVRRLRPFEDTIYEGGHACEAFIQIRTVRHQAAVARDE